MSSLAAVPAHRPALAPAYAPGGGAFPKTTAADSWHLRNTIAPMILAGAFAPRFRLALAHKDLGLALRMGLGLGVPLPVASGTHLVHTLAMGAGLADEDQAACVKLLERAAGIEARPSPGTGA